MSAQRLIDALGRCAQVHVTVVGDIMLDEYVSGRVERISPEAPVPILRAQAGEVRLGGAANVAQQVAALGARVALLGVIGNDEAGGQVLELCRERHIDASGVRVSAARRTTRKMRILGASQQLMRLDWEDTHPLDADDRAAVLGALGEVPEEHVLIVSDYAKGLLDENLLARSLEPGRAERRVVVDPKNRDFSRYRGARIVTPNLRELGEASGVSLMETELEPIVSAARGLRERHQLGAVVVTLGEQGILVVDDGPAVHLPADRRAVFDVTGAGDTAVAVLATAVGCGAPLVDAAQLANVAAGIAVGQVGTTAVSASEIIVALLSAPSQKLASLVEVASRARQLQHAGKTVVFTNGCFDLLHAGHLSLLNFAKSQGDWLVLAINSDAAVRRLKGPMRPVVSQSDRAAMLGALSCVDAVVIFEEDTPLESIQLIQPDVLVKGRDYQLSDVVGRDVVESRGGRVVLAPLLPDYSTTSLIHRVRKPREAADMPPALQVSLKH